MKITSGPKTPSQAALSVVAGDNHFSTNSAAIDGKLMDYAPFLILLVDSSGYIINANAASQPVLH
jgi:hypothetical protein